MLGIIIGVSAVITLVSVGRGVENYIGAAFGSIGTDLLFVLPGSPKETSSGPPSPCSCARSRPSPTCG